MLLGFSLPDDAGVKAVIRNALGAFHTENVNWTKLLPTARGLSHAESVIATHNAAKRTALDGRTQVRTNELITALEELPGVARKNHANTPAVSTR